MKSFLTAFSVGSVLIALFSGCGGNRALVKQGFVPYPHADSATATPWTHERYPGPDEFVFAIVSDRTGGHRPGIFQKALESLIRMSPDFVMCVGDLIQGYTENGDQIDQERSEIDSLVGALRMPFFRVAGNHDVTNPVMADDWERRYGKRYYHFTYKDALFLCMNTQEDSGKASSIDSAQFRYFEKVLTDNSTALPVFVFFHKPMWIDKEVSVYWQKLEAMLASRQHYVFAGHYHNYGKSERNGGMYYNLATTGGGSSLRGFPLGEFDHMLWVAVDSSGARVTNLMLD